MWFDGQRQPDTIYVASTSRGKDSTAMLRAIELMGWPLDMICAVDIWATQDIPAELPPMVAFKDEYDQKVLDWFGIPVTRLCATKRERLRRGVPLTKTVIRRRVLLRPDSRAVWNNQRVPRNRKVLLVQETQNGQG